MKVIEAPGKTSDAYHGVELDGNTDALLLARGLGEFAMQFAHHDLDNHVVEEALRLQNVLLQHVIEANLQGRDEPFGFAAIPDFRKAVLRDTYPLRNGLMLAQAASLATQE